MIVRIDRLTSVFHSLMTESFVLAIFQSTHLSCQPENHISFQGYLQLKWLSWASDYVLKTALTCLALWIGWPKNLFVWRTVILLNQLATHQLHGTDYSYFISSSRPYILCLFFRCCSRSYSIKIWSDSNLQVSKTAIPYLVWSGTVLIRNWRMRTWRKPKPFTLTLRLALLTPICSARSRMPIKLCW